MAARESNNHADVIHPALVYTEGDFRQCPEAISVSIPMILAFVKCYQTWGADREGRIDLTLSLIQLVPMN